jgi:hypothetical protein
MESEAYLQEPYEKFLKKSIPVCFIPFYGDVFSAGSIINTFHGLLKLIF